MLLLLLAGCFALRPSNGGGEVRDVAPRTAAAADVALPEGYRIEVVATGLTFPTAVTFDDAGGIYVVEAGYAYGEVFTTPRILEVLPGGGLRPVVSGENPPWTGAVWHEGAFYIAEGGQIDGGRIVRARPNGPIEPLVEGLPGLGDHHTNGPAIGPDGWLYFGQGTATNSAVVGEDNRGFGWLERHPDFHDTPCEDVVLAGQNFESRAPDGKKSTTGAYVPFGTPTEAGQVIAGRVPCSGAVMKVPLEGGGLEMVAWGFRNPFGLAFTPDGTLYVSDNGYDVRGSRPVWGNGDWLWRVEPGRWYGWPDYAGGQALGQRFDPPGKKPPRPLLAEPPDTPPKPAATFGVHSSADGLDFARNEQFGHVGEAFVAVFGDMAPNVGKVLHPVGYNVVRVDVATGVIHEFATNSGKTRGPASLLGTGGLERPVAVRFDPAGTSLYIVDFGVMTTLRQGAQPRPGTGVLWRVWREG
ncbi:MAG: PQQ-dependent sugar dehydrogenase [Pseudomonadota bacterium]|nr:PQQ-dependent sugar dehydrogenase [Pseudomonadota bacterium]